VNPSRPFIFAASRYIAVMAACCYRGDHLQGNSLFLRCRGRIYPTIQVVTFDPGASPDVTASAITAPLERQFGQMPGLNQMTSVSRTADSIITLQFALNLNIDVARTGSAGSD